MSGLPPSRGHRLGELVGARAQPARDLVQHLAALDGGRALPARAPPRRRPRSPRRPAASEGSATSATVSSVNGFSTASGLAFAADELAADQHPRVSALIGRDASAIRRGPRRRRCRERVRPRVEKTGIVRSIIVSPSRRRICSSTQTIAIPPSSLEPLGRCAGARRARSSRRSVHSSMSIRTRRVPPSIARLERLAHRWRRGEVELSLDREDEDVPAVSSRTSSRLAAPWSSVNCCPPLPRRPAGSAGRRTRARRGSMPIAAVAIVGGRLVVDEVADQQDHAGDRHREEDEPDRDHPVRVEQDPVLDSLAEQQPVADRRGDQAGGGDRGADQGAEVDLLLKLR